jgi:hypothetical protein
VHRRRAVLGVQIRSLGSPLAANRLAQEKPLEFIRCIAGERYWVGDKNKDFMKGGPAAITT